MSSTRLSLFGGDIPWNPHDWTASDDRVRGGKSQSYLDCSPHEPTAIFYGNLDITTLGGAGFASQRTIGEDRCWDLSAFHGIEISVVDADEKRYTLVVKDEILPPNPEDGREQSTLSYEYDFRLQRSYSIETPLKLFIPWRDLKATYRGREKKDAPGLVTSSIKRISLMMRSFFGDQEGHFSLSLTSISAVKQQGSPDRDPRGTTTNYPASRSDEEKPTGPPSGNKDNSMAVDVRNEEGILHWIWATCTVS